MRWQATLSGWTKDIERLSGESFPGMSPHPNEPKQLLLEFQDPEGEVGGSEAPHAAYAVITAAVERLNGLGRLRWGRVFAGLSLEAIRSFDEDGVPRQYGFVGTAVDHMLPEDYADMVERLGHPRPAPPRGLAVVEGVELSEVAQLAEVEPDVHRALHLVNLMLKDDHEIDWVAGYAALEIVEQDLHAREVDLKALGLWTKSERADFKATANSPEVLGYAARHGTKTGLTEARMTSKEARWFVRRVVSGWVLLLLGRNIPPVEATS